MKTVHFVMQGKGGAGKTFTASILAQYLAQKTGKPIHCFDTEPINKSFSQMAALNVDLINILTEKGEVDPRQFDTLIEKIVSQDGTGVIDNGATSPCQNLQTGAHTQVDKRTLDRAAELAGIRPLKFHDLRHTWASWHVQSGTPLMVLKELGGWETIQMVQKYAHLDAGHLSNYANVTEFTSHFRHTSDEENKKAASKSGSFTYRGFWWPGAESNCRHKDFQSSALPTELPGQQRTK